MPWRTAGVGRILAERKDVTLFNGYRERTCRIVLLCKQGVYAVDAVLWRVVHPTIIGLVCPSKIYCVYIRGDCGLNFHPMRLTCAPTLVGTMQDNGVVNNFY